MTLPVFPSLPGITWPVTRRGPIFDTVKEQTISGRSSRFANRTQPKWQWEIPFDILFQGKPGVAPSGSNADMATLAGFFAQLYGGALPFLFTDPDDCTATNQQFGTGNGTAVSFQLIRTMGGFSEKVLAVNGAISVWVGALLMTAGVDYNVSSSGVVTFAAAPANGAALTWTGSFYWLCEMDDDQIEFEKMMQGRYSVKKLTFSSKVL